MFNKLFTSIYFKNIYFIFVKYILTKYSQACVQLSALGLKKWLLFKSGRYSQFIPIKLLSVLEKLGLKLAVVARWSLFRGDC